MNKVISDYSMKAIGFLWIALVIAVASFLYNVQDASAGEIDRWYDRGEPYSITLAAVTYGNSQFVVVGESGTILTSADGTLWTERISGTDSYLSVVAYGNVNLPPIVGQKTGENKTISCVVFM